MLLPKRMGKLVTLIFPIVQQMQGYSKEKLFTDLLNALSIASILLPQCIAYASLAKVSPIHSIVSGIYPLVIYALFGADKRLSIGPAAVTATLCGVAVARQMKLIDTSALSVEEQLVIASNIASALALLCGIMSVLMAFIKAQFLDGILAGYLLTGYLTAVAVSLIVDQFPVLIGLSFPLLSSDASSFDKIVGWFQPGSKINFSALILGVCCSAWLLGAAKLKQKYSRVNLVAIVPEILILVVVTILISHFMDLASYGILLAGALPSSVPAPAVPQLTIDRINALLVDAASITLIGYLEAQSVAAQDKAQEFPSGDRELFALGMSNIVCSFFGIFPTFSSIARSELQGLMGANSNLLGVATAMFVFVLYSTCANFLSLLPRGAMSAIIMKAAISLFNLPQLRFLLKTRSPVEITLFSITFLVCFFLSVGKGTIICVAFAIFIILRRTTQLDMIIFGQVMVDDRPVYVDLTHAPTAKLVDNALMIGIRGHLEFYNAPQVRRGIELLLDYEEHILGGDPLIMTTLYNESFVMPLYPPPAKLCILLDISHCSVMDSAALYQLTCMLKLYQTKGIHFLICGKRHANMFKLVAPDLRIFESMQEMVEFIKSPE